MSIRTKIVLAAALVAIGLAGRVLPHAWNFTPIIAIALFSGAYIGKRYALLIPIATMLIGDVFLGFYNPYVMLSVYASIAISFLVGSRIKEIKILSIAYCSAGSSILFFILTNAAVWAFSGMYPLTSGGLLASYVAGLPFMRNMVVGDLWYTFVLFGAYEGAVYAYAYFKNKTGPCEVRLG